LNFNVCKKRYTTDLTLRDGNYAACHRHSLKNVQETALVLDKARVDSIEVANGDSRLGPSLN
jgi:4-hydroxy 2-oxovalerate aldolase